MKYDFLASIDIDAQQCFTPLCPQELPVHQGDKISDELNAQAKYSKLRVGSKDAHSPHALWVTDDNNLIFQEMGSQHENIDKYWPEHAIPGTRGFELIPGLPSPCEYDFFVWKGIELDMHPYGACYHDLSEKMSTGLIEYLKYNKITHVVAGGLSLDFCVKTTVLQLLQAGFKVIVNLSATRGLDPNLVIAAKQEMQSSGAIFIDNTDALIDVLK